MTHRSFVPLVENGWKGSFSLRLTEQPLGTAVTDDIEQLSELAAMATYVVSVSAIVLELVWLRLTGTTVDHQEGRASVFSGLLAFGGLGLANRFFFIGLMHVFWSVRLMDWGTSWLGFLLVFILYDFMFYVGHVAGHRIRLFWCFHSVHHTSEEMRLTTAIRGSMFDFVYLPWFFVWIPLLGFHPALVLVVEAIGRLWGVMVHAHPSLVGRLGWLDLLLVTPSVHRVHHGRNSAYIDRNYGEVLLLWDHLFGSHTREEEEPDYGILGTVDSKSLREIQVSPWKSLVGDLRRSGSLQERCHHLFAAPGTPFQPKKTVSKTMSSSPG